jgi:hypothetical protein
MGSRLITDNSVNNTQYKKILELMLDLERKTEKQLMDHKIQTADSIIQGFDIRAVRKEY